MGFWSGSCQISSSPLPPIRPKPVTSQTSVLPLSKCTVIESGLIGVGDVVVTVIRPALPVGGVGLETLTIVMSPLSALAAGVKARALTAVAAATARAHAGIEHRRTESPETGHSTAGLSRTSIN